MRAAVEEQRFRDVVERGLADVRAGRVVDGDAMEHWLSTWGDDDEAEPPAWRK
ncbi:MAG: hypothetical protein Q8O67_14860 [Deltaproteobacteria bacterium]|nr:hypothetical protein [Deltaproteobacteria bacterium]